jgi:CRP-like cAMP-binding protein
MTFSALKAALDNFGIISDEDWQMLMPYLEERNLKKGELFAEEGKYSNEIGFVLNGMLRHYYTKEGEQYTTYFYFENHFVTSYISCIKGIPSELSIEALSDCSIIVFPYDALKSLFAINMNWQAFGRLIAEYIAIGLEERMVGLLIDSPEERYIKLIEGNKKKIIERIPQHYIANYLGITPVSLSRIRKRISQ